MHYAQAPLILTDNSITDATGTIKLEALPDLQPRCSRRLFETTPLIERLWRIALTDIESNIVKTDNGEYFGAGSKFGIRVYTRDIAYSGLLGLNRLYPKIMFNSIRLTRQLRSALKFRVSQGHVLKPIDAPWIEEAQSESEFLKKWKTNSYTRRTDDVVWLWCTADLLTQNKIDEWEWLYETGKHFFQEFYQPFHDASDGLYFGQASFIDIHFTDKKTTGYPSDWSIEDCVMVKSLSTNCLYLQGLKAMEQAANRTGHTTEAHDWHRQSESLKSAIRQTFQRQDGTMAYLKDRNGALQSRREALGSALAVLSGLVCQDDAKKALASYPITDGGVPLFHPFFDTPQWYHNNSSWPFVDTFFIKALEMSDNKPRVSQNAALLARSCVDDGTFHEVSDYRTREVKGSGSQLWSAASFVDTCFRAGLIPDMNEAKDKR
jgi:hypothetical protein